MESFAYIAVDNLLRLISVLLQLIVWAIIINAILSWLVAFDVVNLRNRFVASVAHFLDAVTAPILYPIQRVIPSLGGVDISPIIAILLIQFVIQGILIDGARATLLPMLG